MSFHVDSETGRLKQVILHPPDLELKRLTPTNKDALLFDDVLWVKRAREGHDVFADTLRDRGVRVHLLADLLTETPALPAALQLVQERVFDEREFGVLATDRLRAYFDSLDPAVLSACLIRGVTKGELLEHTGAVPNVRLHAMAPDDSSSHRCRTTCSRVTRRAGCTTG